MFFQSIDASSTRPSQSNRSASIRRQSQQFHPSTKDTRQSVRRPSLEDGLSTGKRRSFGLTLHQLDPSSFHDQASELSIPHYFRASRAQGSQAGSVVSAPTLMYHASESQDPQSISARSLPQTTQQYPHESSSSARKPQLDDIRSHSKVARKLIVELSRASETNSPERRIAAITNACAAFDHGDEPLHNMELEEGAAKVLTKIITATNDEDELRMLCTALEMVFRAELTHVHAAFEASGSALLIALMEILERAAARRMNHADVIILNVSRVLLYLSRVQDLRPRLARKPGMINCIRQARIPLMNAACRITHLRVAANLVDCDDNKALLCGSPGFLDTLMFVAHADSNELARDYAVLALMDLASFPANQIAMAAHANLLATLVKMVLVEETASARESAISALQNLAYAKENRVRLVVYKEGIVLEALRHALSSDANDKARRRASGALTNLACIDTAVVMGNHKGLLDTLATVAANDANPEVQSRAAMALTKVAGSITLGVPCFEKLLDALVVASLSQTGTSVSAVFRLKARDPVNRESMARHPGVLDTLADICIDDSADLKDKDNAMRALMHLTNESANHKVTCNKKILNALVKGASMDGANIEEIRDSAICALERLATEFSNRAYMARHEGLLVAVAQATEREAQLEAAGAISGRSFLAKPLLMSLLVAM